MCKKIFILALFLLLAVQVNKSSAFINDPKITNEIILVFLEPTINESIQNYYSNYITGMVSLPPYAMDIMDIKRPDTTNHYKYQIKILLKPYVGPHISVGEDIITLTFDFENIRVDQLLHVKNEELPPNWKHILK